MAITYVKFIESSDHHDFQAQLQQQLYALDDVAIPLDSIRVSLAIGPGPHFGALVTWVDVEAGS